MLKNNTEKVWNINFFLLWQGQFVSGIGDFVYQIAIGFWVLSVTGSTALMATLMASSLIPQLIVFPFSGVVVDRVNRKWMIVSMDLIRGFAVLLIAIAAFMGILKIWMVFTVGIILGVCLAFFNPSVQSSLPDIVPRSKLVKANAAFSMIGASSKIIGDSLGGFFFQILGVPLLFLTNSLSYLLSAVTGLFLVIPNVHHDAERMPFFKEMRSGFVFTWENKGIRNLFISTFFTNFFRIIGIILILPLFQMNKELGAALYGLSVGTAAAGAFAGFLFSSIIHIKPSHRFFILCLMGSAYSICRMIFPFFLKLYIILPLMFISGVAISLALILFDAGIQTAVPADKRGKVFALLNTLTSGVWPLGMILAGVLAEFISIPFLISVSSALSLLCYVVLFFIRSAKNTINFEPTN